MPTRVTRISAGTILLLTSVVVLGFALWKTPRDPLVYLGLVAVIVGTVTPVPSATDTSANS